jgi:hypothetical protein
MIMAATGKSKFKSGLSSILYSPLDKKLEVEAVNSSLSDNLVFLLLVMLFLKYTVTFEDTLLSIMSGFASPVIAILSYFPESSVAKIIGATALQ